MNMWTRIGLVALVAAALTAPASALTVIDDFTEGGLPLKVEIDLPFGGASVIPYDYTFETGLTSVLGGTRKMELELEAGSPGSDTNGDAKIFALEGKLIYSNDDGVNSFLTLTYDADGMANTAPGTAVYPIPGGTVVNKLVHDGPGLGADLAQGGANVSVLIDILSTDLSGDIMVTVVDSGGTVAEKAETFVSQGAGTIAFNFVDFAVTDVGDDGVVNWSNIDSVQFVFDPIEAGDMTFSILGTGTIPEPLTMLAVGSAIAGVGGYIRRRRRDA